MTTFQGYIDSTIDGQIYGWTLRIDTPNESLEVQLEVDGNIVAKTVASHIRNDLIEAGFDSSHHGFSFSLGNEWRDGNYHTIRIVSIDGENCVNNSPMSVVIGEPINFSNSDDKESFSEDISDIYDSINLYTTSDASGPRFLISTHHLFQMGGSEIVSIELFEELRRRKYEVSLYCPFAEVGFLDETLGFEADVIVDAKAVNLANYDIVYSHHQTLSPVLAQQTEPFPFSGPVPLFVYNHLSPFEPFEFPGPFIEARMADLVMCNSPETARRLADFGYPFERTKVFPNPAPASFEAPLAGTRRRRLRNLISVSNHVPPELTEAFDLLESRGVKVTRVGYPNNERRLIPGDIAGHDAVVTIGKTVQYAMRSRRPVYCYDSFGGPGWLKDDNRTTAADTNFSGRCRPQRHSAEIIAKELIDGFGAAFSAAQKISREELAPYSLEKCVDELLAQLLPQVGRRHPIQDTPAGQQAEYRRQWHHEASLYGLIHREYRAGHPFTGRVEESSPRFRERMRCT